MKKNFQINVHSSINSGQVFLWKKVDAKWYGIDGDNILVLDRKSKFDKNDKLLFNFLRIDDDFEKILEQLRQDKIVNNAVTLYPGLKIFRQNPFQCYISFIVSSNSNISKIQLSLQNLCKKFGKQKLINGVSYFLFPKPNVLAEASIHDIEKCGLGYRSKSVKNASQCVINGEIDFEYLKKTDYHNAKKC